MAAKPSSTSQLEPGVHCVPISAAEAAANLRICVIIRETADPVSGHFVILRHTPDARVLLGAASDAAGHVHEWLELWIQSFDTNHGGDGIEATNAARDAAWARLTASLQAADRDAAIVMHDQQSETRPAYLRLDTHQPWHPASDSGDYLLCRDDAALEAAGLPKYSLSAARFARAGAAGPFLPLTSSTPAAGENIAELRALIPGGSTPVALNAAAGSYFVRRLPPLALEEFAETLAGRSWSGLTNARRPFRLSGIYRELDNDTEIRAGGRHFHRTRHGHAARALETLCLKLLLLDQCLRAVAAEVRRTSLPLLNVTPESFGVSLGATGDNLPFCWTARTTLVRPGDAAALEVPTSQTRYFSTRVPPTASIYRPEELALPRQGTGSVRLRKVFPPADGGLVAEGTLITHERLNIQANELLRLRIPMKEGALELYGTSDTSAALAPGEAAFRTIPLYLDEPRTAALRSYEGIPFGHVPFEVLQPLSSPCDLYALGVIGLRLLFAGSDVTLPTALDSTLSLARFIASEEPGGASLSAQIERLFSSDPRWLATIGPQHLMVAEGSSPDSLPIELWAEVFASLLPFFPGRGPFSICRDFADAPALAPHTIFDAAARSLESVQSKVRSLFLGDLQRNAEIHELLRSYL